MVERTKRLPAPLFVRFDGEIIGAVGVVPYLDTFNKVTAFKRNPDSPATAEVGLFWAIDPAYHRKGYAPEAARAVRRFAIVDEENFGTIGRPGGADFVIEPAVVVARNLAPMLLRKLFDFRRTAS